MELPGKIHLPEIQRFFRSHAGKDAAQVALNLKPVRGIPVQELSLQLASRNKAKRKLPEWYACETVVFPEPFYLQQSSSELTARFKATIFSGQELIDLSGGTGIDTFYLSDSFSTSTYVERNNHLVRLATHNFSVLKKSNIRIVHTAAENFLHNEGLQGSASLYIDPSRRDDENQKVYRFKDCSPDITTLFAGLSTIGEILIKASPMIDLTQAIREIPLPVCKIYVISVKNECKEVLFITGHKASTIPIVATDLVNGHSFSFTREEELASISQTGDIGNYLYEPNAAILKAGGVNVLAQNFHLTKLHDNTHLYSADIMKNEFPGRIFTVEWTSPYRPARIKKLLSGTKANITIRNFPDSVKTIRKKTGITPGGDDYLFAYTNFKGEPEISLCHKLEKQ